MTQLTNYIISSLFIQSSNTTTFHFRHTEKKVIIIPVSSGIYEAFGYSQFGKIIFCQTRQSQMCLCSFKLLQGNVMVLLLCTEKVNSLYLSSASLHHCFLLQYRLKKKKKGNFSSSFLMLTGGKNDTSSNVTNY